MLTPYPTLPAPTSLQPGIRPVAGPMAGASSGRLPAASVSSLPVQSAKAQAAPEASGRSLDKPVVKHGLKAAGLVTLGLLLHRLPARPSSFQVVSSDWKDWARVGLGAAAVTEFNKSLDWHPNPWQLGLQTVTAITALTNGLAGKQGWKNFPLLAVFVPLLVQGTHALTELAEKQLEKTDSTIPRWVPEVAISLSSTIIGIFALRGVLKTDGYQRLSGQKTNASATEPLVGTGAIACTRCGAQHLLCMSEVGDMLGSLGAWLKGNAPKQKEPGL